MPVSEAVTSKAGSAFMMVADFIAMCLYIIEGAFVSLFNGIVIVLIVTDRNLRQSSELLFITGLCFADWIDSTGYFNAGIVRLRNIVLNRDDQPESSTSCFYTSYVTLFFYGYQVAPLMMLIVSVERFLAVFSPVRHGSISTSSRLFVMICVLIWVSITYGVACYILAVEPSRTVTVQCFAAEVFGPELWAYVIGQRSIVIILCVLIYIPIFVKTRQILKRKQENPKIQRFNTTMTLIVFSALFLLAIPDTLCFFNVFGMSDYQIVFYIISVNKSIVNVFVYTLRQRELKNKIVSVAKKVMCCWKTVAPTTLTLTTVTADVGRMSTVRQ
uniref:G_PROTEIN_RECEP_F1_2 domain-containing protein n=1 Tax=Steinernema glaseri TaxID=37863 RepID=A0A1I7Y4Z5_9BILA